MKQKKGSLFSVVALIVVLAFPQAASAIDEASVKAMLKTMNDQLAAAGEDFRIAYVDLEMHDAVGITVYANDRQHQLDAHWLPFDPDRFGTRDIYWAIDQKDQTLDIPWTDAVKAIDSAMNLWNTVPCASIPLVQVDDQGLDLGYVQYLLGMGGVAGWLADITHAGFLPWAFFEIIGGPGGGDSILGVTFTFIWTARPEHVAFREIYENDKFDWGIDIRYHDVETVVAHEVGHGLSLGHFGKIFKSTNGKLHFAPRALMNAIYYDILHRLLGTDNASFCSIWDSWPNN